MKLKAINFAYLGIFVLLSGCDTAIYEYELLEAEHTGVNTARVVYSARYNANPVSLREGDVYIFNIDYTKRYKIISETNYSEWGEYKYAIDITVEPNWEPGDKVTVTGRGFYLGDASFDVPQ